jgi:hypothetical protein
MGKDNGKVLQMSDFAALAQYSIESCHWMKFQETRVPAKTSIYID